MLTALIFIIVIGILVLVHEWGHFIMARKAGMKVEEFGFGFPPRLWGIKKGETIYSINWIPFGGFVKIYGEDGEDRINPRSFGAKPFWPRFKVIAAGVFMNFLLAVLLLMLANFFGLRIGLFDELAISSATDKKIQIVDISSESPAEKVELRIFDEVTGFKQNNNLVSVSSVEDVQAYVSDNRGENINLIILRGSEEIVKEIRARKDFPEGEGPLGISLVLTGVVSYPWYESMWRGLEDAVILLINTIAGYAVLFWTLFTTGRLTADVSGPIGIATVTGQIARISFSYLMQFVALISINLAVLNAVPFPALDGGRGLLLVIEKIKGSPLNKKVEMGMNTAGFILLITLMIYVTIKDIIHFF